MLVFFLIIITIVFLLSFIEDYLGDYKWLVYIILGFILIVYAGFRPIGFDRDSYNYELTFMNPDTSVAEMTVEPSYRLISMLCYHIWPDVHTLFLFYATLGVSIKLWAIRKLSPVIFLPILIYISNFFLLHELTQIRVGIASAIFLLSIKPLSEGRKGIAAIYIVTAIFFHFSAVALLPILFLNNEAITTTKKIILACIVPVCFALYFIGLDLLTSFNIPYLTEKIELYQAINEYKIEKESILNPFPLIRMAVFLYAIYFSETIKEFIPSIYLLIKIMGCSLIVYFAFSSVTVISMRIAELYGIIELIMYPGIIYTVRPFYAGKMIVSIIACILLYFQLVQWKILDFSV